MGNVIFSVLCSGPSDQCAVSAFSFPHNHLTTDPIGWFVYFLQNFQFSSSSMCFFSSFHSGMATRLGACFTGITLGRLLSDIHQASILDHGIHHHTGP